MQTLSVLRVGQPGLRASEMQVPGERQQPAPPSPQQSARSWVALWPGEASPQARRIGVWEGVLWGRAGDTRGNLCRQECREPSGSCRSRLHSASLQASLGRPWGASADARHRGAPRSRGAAQTAAGKVVVLGRIPGAARGPATEGLLGRELQPGLSVCLSVKPFPCSSQEPCEAHFRDEKTDVQRGPQSGTEEAGLDSVLTAD